VIKCITMAGAIPGIREQDGLEGVRFARATECYNLADLLQQIELSLHSYPLNPSWRKLQAPIAALTQP